MFRFLFSALLLCSTCFCQPLVETLPPLMDGRIPRTLEELWAGYDPRAEPLEVEVLKEWEQDGVVLKVLRYRVGVFNGKKAMMAAVYGYPKGAKSVPGLVQMHGGGQYADQNAVLTNGKRGYATISIAWAGRLAAKDYHVNPSVVTLFWEGKTEDPAYRLTTDWGGIDAYHAPCRWKGSNFVGNPPSEHTIDKVPSPRNSGWYFCTIASRRALTFLENQPQVDPERLGAYGHSMGGKLTVLLAGSDARLKAAAPSCGGMSNRSSKADDPFGPVMDDASLKNITCPIFFLSPANDFHGKIEDLQTALEEVESGDWRIACAAHHQHQDTREYEVATQIWFDQILMNRFVTPQTPRTELQLATKDGSPVLRIFPDSAREILSVDVFLTRDAAKKPADRYWHHVSAGSLSGTEGQWTASLELFGLEKPLWVYANVLYKLDETITGAGYYYGTYTTDRFVLSSKMHRLSPEELNAQSVRSVLQADGEIEDFSGEWQKEWYIYGNKPDDWRRTTRKLGDDLYQAPDFAKLAFLVRSEEANQLVLKLDDKAAVVDLPGGEDWHQIVLYPTDFRGVGDRSRIDWKDITSLQLSDRVTLKPGRHDTASESETFGAPWKGNAPELQNMRWLSGTRAERDARRTVRLLEAPPGDGAIWLTIDKAERFSHGYQACMNTWLDGTSPLVLEGKTYEHGLTTHAPSEASYFLGGKFSRFKARAMAKHGSVTFAVHVDGEPVFESGKLGALQWREIDVSLEGAAELRLVVGDGGDGKGGDHVSWLDARVETAPSAQRPGEPRLIVRDDFEQGLIVSPTTDKYGGPTGVRFHAPAPRLRAYLGGAGVHGDTGADLYTGSAASGKKALRIWQTGTPKFGPVLSWWLYHHNTVYNGALILSFAFLVPEQEGMSFTVIPRGFKGPKGFGVERKDAFSLACSSKSLSVLGKTLEIVPGQWVQVRATVPVGQPEGLLKLQVTDANGTRELEAMMDATLHRVDWIGFWPGGQGNAQYLLDDLAFSVTGETPLETVAKKAPAPSDDWKNAPASLVDVFPPSLDLVPAEKQGETHFTSSYYESGSTWEPSLDERWVFHRELKHEGGKDDGFSLRIGKGGQLYSLRGAFGESVPPSFRGDGGSSPWNDEVWQFVAICGKYNDTILSRGQGVLSEELTAKIQQTPIQRFHVFIHNSGGYMEGDLLSKMNNLYCPLLAAADGPDGRSFRSLNWGFIPWSTVHRAPILYYVQTRDAGEGIIEVTYVVHNFSHHEDFVLDWLNAPWGGTRHSSLPYHFVSKPDGGMWNGTEVWRDLDMWNKPPNVRETGGWNLSCAGESADSPALALVFGRDRHLEAELDKKAQGQPYCQFAPSAYRDASAWDMSTFHGQDLNERPENEWRNYDVSVVIPKFRLAPGTSIWYRSFLVVNRKERAIELAKSLVDKVDYGLLTFDPATTPDVPVFLRDGKIVAKATGPTFELMAHPVPGTKPLFLTQNKTTRQEIVTTDIYAHYQTEDLDWKLPDAHPDADYYNNAKIYRLEKNNTDWKRLLGYGYVEKPQAPGYVQLSTLVLPQLFPEASRYHLDLWVKATP